MRIIEPTQFSHNQKKRSRRWPKVVLVLIVLLLVLTPVGYIARILMLPLPAIEAKAIAQQPKPSKPVSLLWPKYGQAAVGSTQHGLLASHSVRKPVPIASITKVITALTVLERKPLVRDEKGPDIVVTPPDIAAFQEYIAKDGVVVPMQLGENLTQYKLLEALLVPSANNAADMIARWAFGTIDEYVHQANRYVAQLGMSRTTVVDASGFSPGNKSTAEDLVLLADAALKHPVIREIVRRKQITLPVAGTVRNSNSILGTQDNIGLKTGTTDEAGGCFLFAYEKKIAGGSTVTIIGAILGAPMTHNAIEDSSVLARSAANGFEAATVLKEGQSVYEYSIPWQSNVVSKIAKDVSFVAWKGQPVEVNYDIQPPKVPLGVNEDIGTARVKGPGVDTSAKVVLDSPITSPSLWWRMKQQWPFNTLARP